MKAGSEFEAACDEWNEDGNCGSYCICGKCVFVWI